MRALPAVGRGAYGGGGVHAQVQAQTDRNGMDAGEATKGTSTLRSAWRRGGRPLQTGGKRVDTSPALLPPASHGHLKPCRTRAT